MPFVAYSGWQPKSNSNQFVKKEILMLHYALVFLIVALVAGVLGASGVASVASQIAWVLFVIAIVLLLVHLLTGRRTPSI
jgi:uncharacterized membrane protein YtjA (UPF0391 family)